MWRRVDLVDWTDISEERIASIFRVEKSASEEPAWAGGCWLNYVHANYYTSTVRCYGNLKLHSDSAANRNVSGTEDIAKLTQVQKKLETVITSAFRNESIQQIIA
jgi:hypothetical protein